VKLSVLFVVLSGALMATTSSDSRAGATQPRLDERPLVRHLDVAVARMDQGERSSEYRKSLSFLSAHADEAVTTLAPFLLEQPGSFRKWQLTYLVGEFGDQSAIGLLRELLQTPLPEPQTPGYGSHSIDLAYSEDLASRIQAVMSIARIASHHPELRDRVIGELLVAAHEVPHAKSTALFELRKLSGHLSRRN
jgi:hypothetical protein